MDNNANSAAAAAAITREVIYNIIKLYKKETPSPRCTPAHQDPRTPDTVQQQTTPCSTSGSAADD